MITSPTQPLRIATMVGGRRYIHINVAAKVLVPSKRFTRL
jgi:hypothetical protein